MLLCILRVLSDNELTRHVACVKGNHEGLLDPPHRPLLHPRHRLSTSLYPQYPHFDLKSGDGRGLTGSTRTDLHHRKIGHGTLPRGVKVLEGGKGGEE